MKCRAQYNGVDDTYVDIFRLWTKAPFGGRTTLMCTIHVDELDNSEIIHMLNDDQVPEFDFITHVERVE